MMRLIKEIKENRRKGLGVPLGPKVQRLQVQGSEGSKTSNVMRQHKTLRDRRSVSNSKVRRLWKLFGGFMRSFPLQPPVVSRNEFKGFEASRVSGNLSVMTKQDNVSSKVRGRRDVDVTTIVKKAIMF